MKLQEFIHENNIKISNQKTRYNPLMVNGYEMDHWNCKLQSKEFTEQFIFSKGIAHRKAQTAPATAKKPTIFELLECLQSDCRSLDDTLGVDDFMNTFGYKSKKEARKIMEGMLKNRTRLQRLFPTSFEQFLEIDFNEQEDK